MDETGSMCGRVFNLIFSVTYTPLMSTAAVVVPFGGVFDCSGDAVILIL